MELSSTHEASIWLYKDDEPVAVVKQNGATKHYKVIEMTNEDYEHLYEVTHVKQ